MRTWVFQAFKIPTGSMEPNLLVGDHLIVNKMRFAAIKRGDVVVFKFPKDPERDFVKRVIGLPGDKIELRKKKVYVNGAPIDEPYAHFIEPLSNDGSTHIDDVREEYGPVNVPAKDQYFMMVTTGTTPKTAATGAFCPRATSRATRNFSTSRWTMAPAWSARVGTPFGRSSVNPGVARRPEPPTPDRIRPPGAADQRRLRRP